MTTTAERQHLEWLAQCPCVICGTTPVQIHHPRASEGMGQRAQHWLGIPLCPEHHTGQTGIHGDRSAWRIVKMDEWDAIAQVVQWMRTRR